MTKRTGNHKARRHAARAEPSPITALRDMLATAYAADIAAVTPMVCEMLRELMGGLSTPERRANIRSALVVLARNPTALAMEVAQELRARFDMKIVPGVDPFLKTSKISLASLSLVDEGKLALDIALDHCAARLREQSATECFQLTSRVAELLGKPALADAENPILPRVFARALLEALARMGFDDEQRLDVFKAFGPALLHIVPDLYTHANELLVELGILADFKAHYGRPVNRVEATAKQKPAPIPTSERELAAILDRLLKGAHGSFA
jgi:hypothetical protein